MSDAVTVLSALAQPTRLRVFRLLMEHEPAGIPAGELARLAGVPQNTLSSHLGVLARAALAHGRRSSRSIIYRADVERLNEVVVHLMTDCCGGRTELCFSAVGLNTSCCIPEASGQE